MRSIFLAALFGFLLVGRPSLSLASEIAEKARLSIVYIFFDVIDPLTGENSRVQGTGFVISQSGYVLTTSHLLLPWTKQNDADKEKNPIKGSLFDKPGFVPASPLNLQVVNPGNPSSEDVALLKLPHSDPLQRYPAVPICIELPEEVQTGDRFYAFGFPLDQHFQPMDGMLGAPDASGGRWQATGAFQPGMSGGPVYNTSGALIGLLKGGIPNTSVVQVTPIQHAANLFKEATVTQQCNSISSYESFRTTIEERRFALADFKTRIVDATVIEVIDGKSGASVPHAYVRIIYTKSGRLIADGSTNLNGQFKINLPSTKITIEVKDDSHEDLLANLILVQDQIRILIPMTLQADDTRVRNCSFTSP